MCLGLSFTNACTASQQFQHIVAMEAPKTSDIPMASKLGKGIAKVEAETHSLEGTFTSEERATH